MADKSIQIKARVTKEEKRRIVRAARVHQQMWDRKVRSGPSSKPNMSDFIATALKKYADELLDGNREQVA